MLTLQEIQSMMSRLDNWSLEENSIAKTFDFPNFKEGLNFLNKIGEVAERMEHHPDVILKWGSVKLVLTTWGEGLSKKDFEMAGEIDKI